MRASELVAGLPLRQVRDGDADVARIVTDSRAVAAGDLFMAREGWFIDSHAFLPDAIARGATSLVVTREDAIPHDVRVPVWLSSHEDRDLGLIADRFYGEPTRSLPVVALTGTNGKSTTVALVASMLDAIDLPAARMGTVGYQFGAIRLPARNTTPDGLVIHGFARRVLDAGARALVMEASSHGIHLRRMAGVRVAVAGFTNLTQDHLDYHGTLEAYEDAKAELFTRDLAASLADGVQPWAVICVDTDAGERMAARVPDGVRLLRVASVPGVDAELRVSALGRSESGATRYRLDDGLQAVEGTLSVPGHHNLQNLAVALGVVRALAPERLTDAVTAVARFPGEAGRMERVAAPVDGEHPVRVDYAHTPDAVARAIEAVAGEGRCTVVVGCGGDRDASKRGPMARAAMAAARVIFTSDNPRSESPARILDEMIEGLAPDEAARVQRIEDRAAAIVAAVASASEGPVLILGKGHETTQEIEATRLHFDDREVARRALVARRSGGAWDAVPYLAGWSAERIASVVGGRLRGRWDAPVTELSTDTRTMRPGALFVALRGERFDAHEHLDAVAQRAGIAVVERGRALDADRLAWIEVECTRTALLDLARALLRDRRRAGTPFRVLGITGSNGKTSTRAMAEAVAAAAIGADHVLATRGNWNNQVGMPLVVSALAPRHRVAILELGISEVGDMDELAGATEPEVAVITSVAEAHTEGLGGLDGVRREKARIITPRACVVTAPEDVLAHPDVAARVPGSACAVAWGSGASAAFRAERSGAFGEVTLTGPGWTRSVSLPMAGAFHAQNFAMAVVGVQSAIARDDVFDTDTLVHACASIFVPAGRMQRRDAGAFVVIDDSYNANPASVAAGLSVLAEMPGPRIAVLGELHEVEGDVVEVHAGLGELLGPAADIAVLVGPLAAHAGARVAANVDVVVVEDVDAALAWFATRAPRPATVWLKASRAARLERIADALVADATREG